MTLTSFAICDVGLIRSENQDNLYINGTYRENIADNSVFRHNNTSTGCGIYAVADGMGGESHGALAALVTVRAIDRDNSFDSEKGMAQYLIERNAVICDLIDKNGGKRIGSTFAGLCICDDIAVITNIGDSRVYIVRNGTLEQKSQDHTAIRQMVELGVVTKKAALKHPDRHKLTQHLGIFPSETIIEPYVNKVNIQTGDIFLLCSDGLTDMIDDEGIMKILGTHETIEDKTEALFAEALKNGGKDNITVIFVKAD